MEHDLQTTEGRRAISHELSNRLGFPVLVTQVANLISVSRPVRQLEEVCKITEQELLAAPGMMDLLQELSEPTSFPDALKVKVVFQEDCQRSEGGLVRVTELEPGTYAEIYKDGRWVEIPTRGRVALPISTLASGKKGHIETARSEFNKFFHRFVGMENVQILAIKSEGQGSWVRQYEEPDLGEAEVWADIAIYRVREQVKPVC